MPIAFAQQPLRTRGAWLVATVLVLAAPGCGGSSGTLLIPLDIRCQVCVSRTPTHPNVPGEERFRRGPSDTGHWSAPQQLFMTERALDLDMVSTTDASGGAYFAHAVNVKGPLGPSNSTIPAEGELVYSRKNPDGKATGFNLNFQRSTSVAYTRVSIAGLGHGVAVCAVTSGGQIHVITRGEPAAAQLSAAAEAAAWSGTIDAEASGGGEKGQFTDVGCAGVRNAATNSDDLHVCGVTSDHHLWHSVMAGSGTTFTPFGDIESQSGERGDFVAVDCTTTGTAVHGVALHVVGVTLNGEAFHTVRLNNWTPFAMVPTTPRYGFPANNPITVRDVAIGFCSNGLANNSELNVLLLASGGMFDAVWSSSQKVWFGQTVATTWRPIEYMGIAAPGTSYLSPAIAEMPFSFGF